MRHYAVSNDMLRCNMMGGFPGWRGRHGEIAKIPSRQVRWRPKAYRTAAAARETGTGRQCESGRSLSPERDVWHASCRTPEPRDSLIFAVVGAGSLRRAR